MCTPTVKCGWARVGAVVGRMDGEPVPHHMRSAALLIPCMCLPNRQCLRDTLPTELVIVKICVVDKPSALACGPRVSVAVVDCVLCVPPVAVSTYASTRTLVAGSPARVPLFTTSFMSGHDLRTESNSGARVAEGATPAAHGMTMNVSAAHRTILHHNGYGREPVYGHRSRCMGWRHTILCVNCAGGAEIGCDRGVNTSE